MNLWGLTIQIVCLPFHPSRWEAWTQLPLPHVALAKYHLKRSMYHRVKVDVKWQYSQVFLTLQGARKNHYGTFFPSTRRLAASPFRTLKKVYPRNSWRRFRYPFSSFSHFWYIIHQLTMKVLHHWNKLHLLASPNRPSCPWKKSISS